MASSMPVKIIDTFESSKVKNVMYGNSINEWGKRIIAEVIKYYSKKYSKPSITDEPKVKELIELLHNCTSTSTFNYKKLLELTKCTTTECVIGYALLAYKSFEEELLIRTINTFGRVNPIDTKDTWYDNWRLNALSSMFNLVYWKSFDKEDNISINKEYAPINQDVNCNFEAIVKFLVGPLRKFIITHNLVQVTMKDYINDEAKEISLSNKEICDTCYKYHPFYYLGAHGCNALLEGEWTAKIKNINDFLNRYPAAICGGIFNTSTYSMAGQHWTAILFFNSNDDIKLKKAVLICSQASNWSAFANSEELKSELLKFKFAMESNPVTIQYDRSSCGLYSVLSIFAMLSKKCDMVEAVNMIGKNASNIASINNKKADIYDIKRAITGWKG